MTDQDRGAYTPPTDAPLSFDARQPVRGSRPLPLTLIVSGLVLALLVAAIVVFYRSGVRQAGQAPATVGEPVGAMKTPAPPEAQPSDPAAGLQIYKSDGTAAAPVAPTFTAPPEQPQVRPASPPPAAVPAAPVQTAQLPAASPAAAGLKPAQPAAPSPKAEPAPKAAPVAKAPPAPAKPAPAKPAAAPAGGGVSVQIGAFSSQALADKGFADAGRIAGVDIAGKTKRVERIQREGSTLYRTSVAGFVSRAEAAAFCGELKAAGKACFVK